MAREQQDREDLFAEATALVRRLELIGGATPVLIGFRRDGAGSVYASPDEVYHFTIQGELRRAFRAGLLYKAERGRLVELSRERTEAAVNLWRRELSDAEAAAFAKAATTTIVRIAAEWEAGRLAIGRMAPVAGVNETTFDSEVKAWLAAIGRGIAIARSPRL